VEHRGWSYLAARIEIRCFMFDPTIRSSLKFLRKNEWARTKLEALYLDDHKKTGKTEDEKTSGASEVHDSLPSTD